MPQGADRDIYTFTYLDIEIRNEQIEQIRRGKVSTRILYRKEENKCISRNAGENYRGEQSGHSPLVSTASILYW
jgi:hypothetical protein